MDKKPKGFTLIEILVVISIIMLLSSFAFTSFKSVHSKARDAQRIAEVRQLQNALELYYEKNGRYPISASCGATKPNSGWCNSVESLNSEGNRWIKNSGSVAMEGFLSKDPLDPLQKTSAAWLPDIGKTIFYYSNGKAYMIVFGLENDPPPQLQNLYPVTICNGNSYLYSKTSCCSANIGDIISSPILLPKIITLGVSCRID